MATAAQAVVVQQSGNFIQWTLLPSVSATDDGAWIDVGDYSEGSIHVTIATTATVQIRGSDAATKPTDATAGLQIGSDITATGLYDLTRSTRWLKVLVSAWTSGAVTATATLRKYAR